MYNASYMAHHDGDEMNHDEKMDLGDHKLVQGYKDG
jgi:hypothetical protein